MQKFIAREKFLYANGAVGWRPGGPMDCLGPWAKVNNCPIIVGIGDDKREVARLTCYATGYAQDYFSIPACTRKNGKYISGYFTTDNDGNAEFHVMDSHKHIFEGV